jgi:hypothetical protein
MRTLAACFAFLLLMPRQSVAQARPATEGTRTTSLGQPVSWKGTLTGGVLWRGGSTAGADGAIGVQRDIMNPVVGFLAVQGEMYATRIGGGIETGARARVLSPVARAGVGADYNVQNGSFDLFISVFHPLRRGGVFLDGSVLRADYVPARRSLSVRVEKPIRRRVQMGGSRPLHDAVILPRPRGRDEHASAIPAAAARALGELAEAAGHVRRTLLPLPPYTADQRGGFDDEVRRYHDALDQAFAAVIAQRGEPAMTALSRDVAARARSSLLDDVLLPYDRLIGQTKKHDSVLGYGEIARANFRRWLHTSSGVPAENLGDVQRVFVALIAVVEDNRAAAHKEWRDSRFVWLPLQYALRSEDHDTQGELDALIERAIGVKFEAGNLVSWVVNEQFQYQLGRTIHAAREYHVLWTHDFRGIDDRGDVDEMAYRQVLHSYLAAMTARVREYDTTGRFPVYMILLDQWFYEVNNGRLWMTLLENPTTQNADLPPTHRAWQDSIVAAQKDLRDAIAGSALLQEQRRQYGDAWLRNLIKVHVSITNPADPVFWSTSVIRGVPLPDNMMRDHRKIVFYDLTEKDPYVGEAMFTGAGVGEHYSNLSWEDRSLLVQGPAVLGLKQAARELLLHQAIKPEQVPHALQPHPRGADYDERILAMQSRANPIRALIGHNSAGFGDKQVNVIKGVLYTLMPAGSVVKIPDSLWNSEFWAAALVGCSLRGVRVLLIAPAKPNAPVDKMGVLGASNVLLHHMLDAQSQLAPSIDAAGGLLKIGLFAPELQVTDIPAKVMSVHTAFARNAWLRELFGFPPSVYTGLEELASRLRKFQTTGAQPEFEYDPTPKLHLKTNFFASREAWTLMQRPEWSDASWSYVQSRVTQIQERSAGISSFDQVSDPFPDVGTAMVEDWLATLDVRTREKVMFFLFVGSHNQNNRSMVTDAEVGFVLSGWPSIIPYIDLIVIIGETHWIEDPAELDQMLPPNRGLMAIVARWIRLGM